jgi:hypothetical protein
MFWDTITQNLKEQEPGSGHKQCKKIDNTRIRYVIEKVKLTENEDRCFLNKNGLSGHIARSSQRLARTVSLRIIRVFFASKEAFYYSFFRLFALRPDADHKYLRCTNYIIIGRSAKKLALLAQISTLRVPGEIDLKR